MNKKNSIIIAIFLIIIIIGGFVYFYSSKNNSTPYQAQKTATQNNINKNSSNIAQTNIDENTSNINTKTQTPIKETPKTTEETQAIHETTPPPITEEQLATFTTKIYSTDSARQANISITCGALHDTIVKNGETFSFCGTVGPATSAKGYQEADIFDKDGNKKKGLGGGNCQISTTLYNALLAASSLTVTERHEHSNDVPYAKKGKDAAVSYGGYDLKFKNTSGYNVKILCYADKSSVTVTLISLKV